MHILWWKMTWKVWNCTWAEILWNKKIIHYKVHLITRFCSIKNIYWPSSSIWILQIQLEKITPLSLINWLQKLFLRVHSIYLINTMYWNLYIFFWRLLVVPWLCFINNILTMYCPLTISICRSEDEDDKVEDYLVPSDFCLLGNVHMLQQFYCYLGRSIIHCTKFE